MTPQEWFALLIERAPALRDAGVLSLSIGEVTVRFAAAVFVPAATSAGDAPAGDSDPLNDPACYPNGVVPGYTYNPEAP